MESITRGWREIKQIFKRLKNHPAFSDSVLVLVIVLVGFGSYGIGRLSAVDDPEVVLCELPTEITEAAGQVKSATAESSAGVPAGTLVGSVNSDIYHLPWCSGAKRISDENKRYFASANEAKQAGYRPAENCEGLE